MYKLGIVFISTIILITFYTIKANCQPLTPTQTVNLYIKADYNGTRMSDEDYLRKITTQLLSWYGVEEGNEGGYDTIYVIKSYMILNETTFQDHANVTVRYRIICKSSAYSTHFVNTNEDEVIRLRKVNNEWRLLHPVIPPRVSIEVGIKDMINIATSYKNATESSGQKTYKQLIEAINKLIEIKNR